MIINVCIGGGNYSTDEQVIDKQIDGKSIYQKTFGLLIDILKRQIKE